MDENWIANAAKAPSSGIPRFALAISLLCLGTAGCVDVHTPPSQPPAATIVTPAPTYVSPYAGPGTTTTVGPAGTTTVQRSY